MKKVLVMAMGLALVGLMACGGGGEGGQGPTDQGPGDVLDPGPGPEGFGNDVIGGGDQQPEVCVPNCQDKECGDDGCGGSCGTCQYGTCNAQGKCECTPDCTGKECGPDGCGGTCGKCTDPSKPICNEQTGLCEPCTPNCEGKECGDDGCGGSCGECTDPNKPVCSKEGQCIPKCNLPDTWGGIGVVTTLAIPEAQVAQQICPDFSGDGKGDCALSQFANMANPEIQKAIAKGDMGILFEFEGVVDYSNTAAFDLNGLVGVPEAQGSTNFLVDPMSYDPDTCEPLIAFHEASITTGALSAGPSVFILDLLALGVQEVPLVLTISDTRITGDVISGGPDGVELKAGVLAGVITKQLVEEALAIAEQQCEENPQSFCSYLSMVKNFLPMLFDLDLDPNVPGKDAMSVCFKFELGKAKITGYKQD